MASEIHADTRYVTAARASGDSRVRGSVSFYDTKVKLVAV